jgi:hypothetical protein
MSNILKNDNVYLNSADQRNQQNLELNNTRDFGNNEPRNFDALNTKPVCKFFVAGNCTRTNCDFRHDNKAEISSKQKIINEIELAYKRGRFEDIFEKMLINENGEYELYYNEFHMKFRGYSVMKLSKQSITKTIIDTIPKENHSMMAFLFHFIMNGFSWNTFQGAKDTEENNKVIECFDEIVSQLQKKYTNEEYDLIILQACDFVDPETQENILMVASHYLCDIVVSHIKDAFKNIKRNKLIKNSSNNRLTMGEEKYNEFLSQEFTDFIHNEKNAEGHNAFALYEERVNNPGVAYQKYDEKRNKAIIRAKNNKSIIQEANLRYEYNIKQYKIRLSIFYNSIFNENIKRKAIVTNAIDYDKLFNAKLPELLGMKSRFGTRCDPNILSTLFHWINNELTTKKEKYMKLIIEKLPNDLLNSREILKLFKDSMLIDYLWSAIINSVSFENPDSKYVTLLNEILMNKEKPGLQEAYVCQYLEQIIELAKGMNTPSKQEFIEIIMASLLNKEIKEKIDLF